MVSYDPPSTLKPAQVAVAMVEHGIAKHKTRGDIVFLKAVSDLLYAVLPIRLTGVLGSPRSSQGSCCHLEGS